MPKFVIEREVPGAGKLTDVDLKALARKSNGVLEGMPRVQWLESFVTDNKIYCVYIAPNVEALKEHARCGQFPADAISQVRNIIGPTTAE